VDPNPGDAMSTADDTPSGWYTDPEGIHEHRWWDGAAWTDDVVDADVVAQDAPDLPADQLSAPTPVTAASRAVHPTGAPPSAIGAPTRGLPPPWVVVLGITAFFLSGPVGGVIGAVLSIGGVVAIVLGANSWYRESRR
jgi:hypothetical protein